VILHDCIYSELSNICQIVQLKCVHILRDSVTVATLLHTISRHQPVCGRGQRWAWCQFPV